MTKFFIEWLKKINIDIKAGELVTLLGPNGAGKSTLFSILSVVILKVKFLFNSLSSVIAELIGNGILLFG